MSMCIPGPFKLNGIIELFNNLSRIALINTEPTTELFMFYTSTQLKHYTYVGRCTMIRKGCHQRIRFTFCFDCHLFFELSQCLSIKLVLSKIKVIFIF